MLEPNDTVEQNNVKKQEISATKQKITNGICCYKVFVYYQQKKIPEKQCLEKTFQGIKNIGNIDHLNLATFSAAMSSKFLAKKTSKLKRLNQLKKDKDKKITAFMNETFSEKKPEHATVHQDLRNEVATEEATINIVPETNNFENKGKNAKKLQSNEKRKQTRERNNLRLIYAHAEEVKKTCINQRQCIKNLQNQLQRRNKKIATLKCKLAEEKKKKKLDKRNTKTKIIITTKEETLKREYTSIFRTMCLELMLDCNIAQDKLKQVLLCIANLCNVQFSEIPCTATLRKFVEEGNTYALYVAGRAIAEDEERKVAMHYDGTTDNQEHLVDTSAKTSTGVISLGNLLLLFEKVTYVVA